jgi:hypothetical protein
MGVGQQLASRGHAELPAARPGASASVIYRAENITSSRLAYSLSFRTPYPTVARMSRNVVTPVFEKGRLDSLRERSVIAIEKRGHAERRLAFRTEFQSEPQRESFG